MKISKIKHGYQEKTVKNFALNPPTLWTKTRAKQEEKSSVYFREF